MSTPISTSLAGKRGLEVIVCLRAFECFHATSGVDRFSLRAGARGVQLINPIRAIGAAYDAARNLSSALRKEAAAGASLGWWPSRITCSPPT